MKITCVLVTFNPNIDTLTKGIKSIHDNLKNIILVDNGSINININVIKEKFNTIDIISLDKNYGVAAAQNIGIKKALKNGADYIWLSDQDTFYPANFSTKMSLCIDELNNKNIKYSVIAPSYIDSNTNQLQPFIKFIPFNKKIFPKKGINYVSQVISSGMIIPSNIFRVVGFKNEALFIDWVDFEWCWRSIRMGYKVVAYGDVVINHNLGDGVILFLGKKINIRTPFRHYFMIRNAIYLPLYTACLNLPMRFEIFIKTLLWIFIFPLSSKQNKYKHFKATLLGFYHGLSAQLGSKP